MTGWKKRKDDGRTKCQNKKDEMSAATLQSTHSLMVTQNEDDIICQSRYSIPIPVTNKSTKEEIGSFEPPFPIYIRNKYNIDK